MRSFYQGVNPLVSFPPNDCQCVLIDQFCLLDGSLGAELGRDKGGAKKSYL